LKDDDVKVMLKLELVHEVVSLESGTKEKDDMKIGVT
jgi:hypothetical protein